MSKYNVPIIRTENNIIEKRLSKKNSNILIIPDEKLLIDCIVYFFDKIIEENNETRIKQLEKELNYFCNYSKVEQFSLDFSIKETRTIEEVPFDKPAAYNFNKGTKKDKIEEDNFSLMFGYEDDVVGYEKVLEYRKILESVSDKIIPVWHNNRGVEDFVEMCKKYKGKKIAITGFANNDIKDSQYNLFINTAHKYGCKIHILGLTRYELIKDLNLGLDDSVDSSSWKQTAIFGGVNLPLNDKTIYKLSALEGLKSDYKYYIYLNYLTAKIIQQMYKEEDYSV